MAGALDRIPDRIFIDRLGFELADTVPCLDDGGYDIHNAGFAPPS
jgi:hypothetical protein